VFAVAVFANANIFFARRRSIPSYAISFATDLDKVIHEVKKWRFYPQLPEFK